jgi:hypothetical protein
VTTDATQLHGTEAIMTYDVWFAKDGDNLYAVTCKPGDVPSRRAHKVTSVTKTLQRIKAKGHTISQVGITDPELLEF